MSSFKTITPQEIPGNLFDRIGKEWALISAQKPDGTVNTMTASWGGTGILWKVPVATIYVRHSRHTFGFVEASDTFTLSFFGEGYRQELAYCGKISGRDEDKIAKCGFTVEREGTAPYFAQAELVVVCRKLYGIDLPPEHFVDKSILDTCYQAGDYHKMYIGEITKVLCK